jgi:hypothetical protein
MRRSSTTLPLAAITSLSVRKPRSSSRSKSLTRSLAVATLSPSAVCRPRISIPNRSDPESLRSRIAPIPNRSDPESLRQPVQAVCVGVIQK